MKFHWPITFSEASQGAAPKALDADTARGFFTRDKRAHYKPKEIADYYEAYLDHDLVRQSVDDLMETALHEGYYTTAKDSKAKSLVDELGEKFNLDDYLINIGKNALIAGFCPVETRLVAQVEKCALKIVHPKTVKDIATEPNGDIAKILQEVDNNKTEFMGDELAWFCYGKLGTSPWGISFVRGMISVLNTLDGVTQDVDDVLDRYVSPIGVWKTTGEASRLESIKKAVTEREPGEDIYLGQLTLEELGKDMVVQFLTVDPRVPFWEYIQWLYERVYSYTRSSNLIFVRNATEASARKMDDIVGRHVAAIQRFLKRGVERYWFKPLCELNGIHETPRLSFGKEKAPTAEIQMERFLTAGVQAGYVDREQFRDLLVQMGLKLKEPSGPQPQPMKAEVGDDGEPQRRINVER